MFKQEKVNKAIQKEIANILLKEFDLEGVVTVTRVECSPNMFFAKVFIKNRGNLSEVQKELEISYPTARNRLEDIVRTMGYEGAQPERTESQKILDMLENGEISSKDAMEMLRTLKKEEKK